MPECRAVRAGLSEVIVDGADWVALKGRVLSLEAALRTSTEREVRFFSRVAELTESLHTVVEFMDMRCYGVSQSADVARLLLVKKYSAVETSVLPKCTCTRDTEIGLCEKPCDRDTSDRGAK